MTANDEAVRRAGFRGYEGCLHADCPTPWECSERGDCPVLFRPQSAVKPGTPRRTELRCQANHRHRYGGGPEQSGRRCPSGDGFLEAIFTHCDDPGRGCGCSLTDHNDSLGCRVCKTECGIDCRPAMRERSTDR